jgi:SAM-dependent methyltransferase
MIASFNRREVRVEPRDGNPTAAWLRESPAAERNKEPIAEVLARVLPGAGLVFEVASGTGQHAEHFARRLPELLWQPTEQEDESLASIAARVQRAALPNLHAPVPFDVHAERAPLAEAAAVLCINMIHIAPWSAAQGLFRHAARLLADGAPLVVYGPFKIAGEHTAPSNAAFDASLRARNAAWGIRDLDAVKAVATAEGFALADCVPMPANNVTVVWRRTAQ